MRPRLGLALLLPLLLTASWLIGAGDASAHAQLVGSSPDSGTDLRKAPASLRLTFSDTVQDKGAAVRVTDAKGTELQAGDPAVADDVVTQKLKTTTAPGTVRVVWRVTSSDGHPISGNFTFSVNAAAAKSTDGPTSDASSTGGLQRTSGTSSDETSYSTSVPSFQRPTDKTNNEPLLIIGVTVVAMLLVGGLAALIRLRSRGDDADL